MGEGQDGGAGASGLREASLASVEAAVFQGNWLTEHLATSSKVSAGATNLFEAILSDVAHISHPTTRWVLLCQKVNRLKGPDRRKLEPWNLPRNSAAPPKTSDLAAVPRFHKAESQQTASWSRLTQLLCLLRDPSSRSCNTRNRAVRFAGSWTGTGTPTFNIGTPYSCHGQRCLVRSAPSDRPYNHGERWAL